jgi:hypothetical protein
LSTLVPSNEQTAAKQRLLSQMRDLPGVPESVLKNSPLASQLHQQNQSGKLTKPQTSGDHLREKGLQRLLDSPTRRLAGATASGESNP